MKKKLKKETTKIKEEKYIKIPKMANVLEPQKEDQPEFDKEYNDYCNKSLAGSPFNKDLDDQYARFVKASLNILEWLHKMQYEFFSEQKKKELSEVKKVMDNSKLDNIPKPNFALEYYYDSLHKK